MDWICDDSFFTNRVREDTKGAPFLPRFLRQKWSFSRLHNRVNQPHYLGALTPPSRRN